MRADLQLLAEQGHLDNVDEVLEQRLAENDVPYSERYRLRAEGDGSAWTMRTLSGGIVMIYTDVTETLAARDNLDGTPNSFGRRSTASPKALRPLMRTCA